MNAKALRQRYQLKTRQALDDRLKALEIKLPKDHRGHRFATSEQIEQLDDLERWLTQGGTLQTYRPANQQLAVLSTAETTNEITKQCFPFTLDLDNPKFLPIMRRLNEIAIAMGEAQKQGGIVGKLKKIKLGSAAAFNFMRLYSMPTVRNDIPETSRLVPAW